jgi:hypothetical protein
MITSIKEYKKNQEIDKDVPYVALNQPENSISNIYNKETFDPIDPNEYYIDKVVDIITDVEEIKEIEEKIKTTSFNYRGVDRNDILWLTVMLKPRNNSNAYPLGEMGVVQAKVLQTFYGLNKLKQLKATDKIINI